MEKWAFPSNTLKHDNAKAPKVNTTVVEGVLENLRSLWVGREGEGKGERSRERRNGKVSKEAEECA